MKNSKKRDKIIEVFLGGDLLTAEDVYLRVKSLDKATIYRNLTLLTKIGILREVNIKKGISSYEINKNGDFHQHFICEICERVQPVEIDSDFIKSLYPKDVFVTNFELNFKGRCKSCI